MTCVKQRRLPGLSAESPQLFADTRVDEFQRTPCEDEPRNRRVLTLQRGNCLSYRARTWAQHAYARCFATAFTCDASVPPIRTATQFCCSLQAVSTWPRERSRISRSRKDLDPGITPAGGCFEAFPIENSDPAATVTDQLPLLQATRGLVDCA